MSSPHRMSPAMDMQELEKYTKYLFYKAAQIIVQSRQGDKIKTPSNPTPKQQSWFCLAINDIAEISAESKRSATSTQLTGRSLLFHPLCVEISLKTVEGDSMVLESWVLSMREGSDPSARPNNTVYNHMGLLLKSLLCVSRAMPAYRLSRRQGPDSFIICYRIYAGESDVTVLGDGFQSCQVGQVLTSAGTLHLRVDFRTSMTINHNTHQSHAQSQPITVNFGSSGGGTPDIFGRTQREVFGHRGGLVSDDSDGGGVVGRDGSSALGIGGQTSDDSSQEAMRIFASSPLDPIHHGVGHASAGEAHASHGRRRLSDLSTSSSSERLNVVGAFVSRAANANISRCDSERALTSTEDPLLELFAVDVSETEDGTRKDAAALAASPTSRAAVTPTTLVSKLATLNVNANESDSSGSAPIEAQRKAQAGALAQGARKKTMESVLLKKGTPRLPGEDFEILDLKTPFSLKPVTPSATQSGGSGNDLGIFFKEAQHAPALKTIYESSSMDKSVLEVQLHGLNRQLENFESSLAEYDELVRTLETASESETENM